MIFLCIPLIIIYEILGGQINKLFRPIGVTLSILVIYGLFHNHPLWCAIPALWYGFTLTLGYGQDSKLGKWLKSEQKVRIVLGLSSALPVLLCSVLTMNWLALIFIPVIVGVECIRMGKWFSIGNFDVLPVDIFRALALSIAVSCALI